MHVLEMLDLPTTSPAWRHSRTQRSEWSLRGLEEDRRGRTVKRTNHLLDIRSARSCLGRMVDPRPPARAGRHNTRRPARLNQGSRVGQRSGRGAGADRLRHRGMIRGVVSVS